MDNFLADELSEAGEDIPHNIEDLILLEFFAFHELLKITVFAELGDDVETILELSTSLNLTMLGWLNRFSR